MAKKTVEKVVKQKKAAVVAEPELSVEPVAAAEAAEPEAPVAAKETAEQKQSRQMIETVKAVVSELVPAMAALSRAATPNMEKAKGTIARWKVCNECKQKGPNAPPCKEEGHAKMVVYPTRYPHFGKHFQGAFINGVRYLSDNRRQHILVPKACISTIMKTINDFEDNEMQTMMGQRVAEHDSGDIREHGGSNVKEVTPATSWR